MPGIAPTRANAKRTALAVLFLCAAAGVMVGGPARPALAQEPVYRCGREYTNTPKDLGQCERLAEQAVTVVWGARPPGLESAVGAPSVGAGAEASGPRPKAEGGRTGPEQQMARDQMARTVVSEELDRVRQQLVQWRAEFAQAQPARSAAERPSPPKYTDRAATLKAAIERAERDIDSLQRELARHPLAAKTPSP